MTEHRRASAIGEIRAVDAAAAAGLTFVENTAVPDGWPRDSENLVTVDRADVRRNIELRTLSRSERPKVDILASETGITGLAAGTYEEDDGSCMYVSLGRRRCACSGTSGHGEWRWCRYRLGSSVR
jgi:hypothetical protein